MSRRPVRLMLIAALCCTVLLSLSYAGHSLVALPTGSKRPAPDYAVIALGLESGRVGVFYYAQAFSGFAPQAASIIEPPRTYFLVSRLQRFDAMVYQNDHLGITPRVTSMGRTISGGTTWTTVLGFSISLWFALGALAGGSVLADLYCRRKTRRGFPMDDRSTTAVSPVAL